MQHLTYTTDDELDALMQERGLHFCREHFRWGNTPAYRDDSCTVFRFIDRGDVLTPTELLTRLLHEWNPATREDISYATHSMRRELQSLEKDSPLTNL